MTSLKTVYVHCAHTYAHAFICACVCMHIYMLKCTHMYRNTDPIHLLETTSASININVLLNWQCYTFLLEFTSVT